MILEQIITTLRNVEFLFVEIEVLKQTLIGTNIGISIIRVVGDVEKSPTIRTHLCPCHPDSTEIHHLFDRGI